jgi:DDE superfamily endonuclease
VEWRENQPTLNPRRLIFIDETWAKTNMVRLRGRCKRGTRLIDTTPHGHWKTSTFIAALSEDGLLAPCVFDGAINGELFLAYVEQILLYPAHTMIRNFLGSMTRKLSVTSSQ